MGHVHCGVSSAAVKESRRESTLSMQQQQLRARPLTDRQKARSIEPSSSQRCSSLEYLSTATSEAIGGAGTTTLFHYNPQGYDAARSIAQHTLGAHGSSELTRDRGTFLSYTEYDRTVVLDYQSSKPSISRRLSHPPGIADVPLFAGYSASPASAGGPPPQEHLPNYCTLNGGLNSTHSDVTLWKPPCSSEVSPHAVAVVPTVSVTSTSIRMSSSPPPLAHPPHLTSGEASQQVSHSSVGESSKWSSSSRVVPAVGYLSELSMGPRKIRRFGCTCPNCASGLNSRTKKRQHVCHYIGCGKVYGKTSHLRTHLRWHTGERPFLCPWPSCGRRFIRSDEMHRHHRTHTGEKRFQCNECGKRFMRSDHLNKHIKTHRKNHRVHVGMVDIDLTCREEDFGMFSPDSDSDTNAPSSSAAMQGVASSYGMGGEDLTCWVEDLGMSSPDSESSPIASVPTTAPAFIDTNAPSSSAAMQGVASSYGMGGEDLTCWEEDRGMSSPDSESSPIASVPTTAPAFIDTNAPSSSAAMQGVASSYGMGGEDLTCWEEDRGMSSPDSESSPIASVPTTAPAFIDTNTPSSSAAMQGVASSYPVSSGLHISELPPVALSLAQHLPPSTLC